MFETIKLNDNSVFVRNNDVANCEAIVFAEAVRRGCTMLEVVESTLNDVDGDDDLELFVACETLQATYVNTYKKSIIDEYLGNLLYNNK